MIKTFRSNFLLVLGFFISFLFYYPSLRTFFTNDDFFLLKIAKFDNLSGFINFFSLFKGPEGLGMYRPLTTQVFYSLAWKIFALNPIGLHAVSFIMFFLVVYLVYILVIKLSSDNQIASTAAFLYAVSATHFGHLYYLATFQELGVTLFVLLSVISYIEGKQLKSIIYFLIGLTCKETAVVTPGLIFIVYLFKNSFKFKKEEITKLLYLLAPYALILAVYMFMRFKFYGFATGDSYVWDFSINKLINTVVWYIVWSLNLPETLVDFVGPGLKLNPAILMYWPEKIIPIFILFFIQGLTLAGLLIKNILVRGKERLFSNSISALSIFWFMVSLIPMVFLPIHKFTFYLTLPLIGVVFRISYLMVKSNSKVLRYGFLVAWTVLSFLTLKHTVDTHWITRGSEVSLRVYNYFEKNKEQIGIGPIVFRDLPSDKILPWSPTQIVKIALSDRNFWSVYYPDLAPNVYYGEGAGQIISSRQFLGY